MPSSLPATPDSYYDPRQFVIPSGAPRTHFVERRCSPPGS